MAIDSWFESKAKEDEDDSEYKDSHVHALVADISWPPHRTLYPLYVHQWIDARDLSHRWFEAQVTAVSESLVRVHYKGFKSKHDEWIDSMDYSDRIALLHSHSIATNAEPDHTHSPPLPLPINALLLPYDCDCQDSVDAWLDARIVDIDYEHMLVLVSYDGWDERFNEWINAESGRLQPRGSHSAGRSSAIVNVTKHADGAYTVRNQHHVKHRGPHHPAASADREAAFRLLMQTSLDLIVIDQAEDGNCLFRSLSHQVYGTPEHHALVRRYCLDYIEAEAPFFRDYVSGEDLAVYVSRLRHDGEWGDHIEIQAMSEIYGASIEIFAYSVQPLATFHRRQPKTLRLSYHGNSHYNSLIAAHVDQQQFLAVNEVPGAIESRAVEQARSRRELALSSDGDELSRALTMSRSEFQSSSSQFDDAVTASLRSLEELDARRVAEAAAESEREELERKEIEIALQEERNEEQRQIQQAMQQSISSAAGAQQSHPQSQPLIADDEADDLSRALAASVSDTAVSTAAAMPPAVLELIALGFPSDASLMAYTVFADSGLPHAALVNSMLEFLIASKS